MKKLKTIRGQVEIDRVKDTKRFISALFDGSLSIRSGALEVRWSKRA